MLSVEEVGQAKGWLSGARSANSHLRSANDELRQLVEEAQKLRELEKQLRESPDSETAKRDRKILRERKRALQKKTEQHAARPVCVVSCPEPLSAALSKAAAVEESCGQKAAFAETWKAAPKPPPASLAGLTVQQSPIQNFPRPAGRTAAIEAPHQSSPQQAVPAPPPQSPRSFYLRHVLPACGQEYWQGLQNQFIQTRDRQNCPLPPAVVAQSQAQAASEATEQHQRPPVLVFVAREYYCDHLLRQCSSDYWERLHDSVHLHVHGDSCSLGLLHSSPPAASAEGANLPPTPTQTHPASASPKSSFHRYFPPTRHVFPVCGHDHQTRQENQTSEGAAATCGVAEYYCQHLLRQCGEDRWERLHNSFRQTSRPQRPRPFGPSLGSQEYYREHMLRQCSRQCWEKLHDHIGLSPVAAAVASPAAEMDLSATCLLQPVYDSRYYCEHLLQRCGQDAWDRLHNRFRQTRRPQHPLLLVPTLGSPEYYCEHLLRQCSRECWEKLHDQAGWPSVAGGVASPPAQADLPAAPPQPASNSRYYCEHLLQQCGQDYWERLHSSVRQVVRSQPARALTLVGREYYCDHLLRQCSRDCWERLHSRIQHCQEVQMTARDTNDIQTHLAADCPQSYYQRYYCEHLLRQCSRDCWETLYSRTPARQEAPVGRSPAAEGEASLTVQPDFATTVPASSYYREHLLRQCELDCWERLQSNVRLVRHPQRPVALTGAAREYYSEHLMRQCSRDFWEKLWRKSQVRQEAQVNELSVAERVALHALQTDPVTMSPRSFYVRHTLPACSCDYWERLHSQVCQARRESLPLAATSTTLGTAEYYREHLLRQCGRDCWERLQSNVRQVRQPQQPLAPAFTASGYYSEHLLRQCSRDFWERLWRNSQARQLAHVDHTTVGESVALPALQTDPAATSTQSFYLRHMLPACGCDYWERLHSQLHHARQESLAPAATGASLGAAEYYREHLLRQCRHDCWERLQSNVRQVRQLQQPVAPAFTAREYYSEHLVRQCSRDFWEKLWRDSQLAHHTPVAQNVALVALQTAHATTSTQSFYLRHMLPTCGRDYWQRLHSQVCQARAGQESLAPAAITSTSGAAEYYCEHVLRQCGQDCWERLHSSVRQASHPQESPRLTFAATEYYREHLLRQCSRDCWETLHCRIQVRQGAQVRQSLATKSGTSPSGHTDLASAPSQSFHHRHLLPKCGHDYWQTLHGQFRQARRENQTHSETRPATSASCGSRESYCEQLRQCSQSCWERLREEAKRPTTPLAGRMAEGYYRQYVLRQCSQDCWERLHTSVRQAGQPQQPVAPVSAAERYYREHLLRQCSADCWEKLYCRMQVRLEAQDEQQLPVADKALDTPRTACPASPEASANDAGHPQPGKQPQEATAAAQPGQERSATLDMPSQRSWFPWSIVKWRRPRRSKHGTANEKAPLPANGDQACASAGELSCAAEEGQDLQLTASTHSGLPGTAVSGSEPSTQAHEENRSPAASSLRLGDSGFLPVVEETPPEEPGERDGLGSVDVGDRISGSAGAASVEGRPSSAKLLQKQLRTLHTSASQCTIESSTTTVPQDTFPVPEISVEVPSSVDLCAGPQPEASELDALAVESPNPGGGSAAAPPQSRDDEPATTEAAGPPGKGNEPVAIEEPQLSLQQEQEGNPGFDVVLQWPRGATGMGIKLHKPRDPTQPELFIREVQADGAAMDYNIAVAKEGLWDMVVKAEMRVTRVNDVQGSAAAMLEAIREVMQEGEVSLRIDSGEPFARSPSETLISPPERGSWEVMLVVDGPAGLGFSASPIREFYGATAPDGLVVTALTPGGLLSRWNEANPQRKVKRGDFILEINNVRTMERAQRQLESPVVQMSLVRYSAVFSVLIEKSGLDLGLVFKRSTTSGVHELLIVDVASGGAVARHNAKSIKGGRWDQAVRPKMCVLGVNGITDDLESMNRSMRACDEVELQIRRTGMFQMNRDGTRHFSRPAESKKDLEGEQAAASTQSPKVAEAARELEQAAATAARLAAPVAAASTLPGQQVRPESTQVRTSQDAFALPEGAMRWDVNLAPGNDVRTAAADEQRGSLGFKTETWQEAYGAKLGVERGPEVLLVSEILPTGLLADWNTRHPESSVKVGDLIMCANGERDLELMQQRLSSAHAELRVEFMRHAGHFTVSIDKAGLLLGLSFRRPAVTSVHELLISDIDPHGAVAAYNRRQTELRRWELVILPKMCVVAVDGVEGDVDKMLEALRGGQRVELRLRRVQRPAKAANTGGLALGAARALKAVRALRGAATPSSPASASPAKQSDTSPSKTLLAHIDKVLRSAVVEVVLQRPQGARSEWHGLEVVSAKDELGAKAGFVGGPHGMIVTQVSRAGALASWNASNAGAEVSVGDWVLQVNTRHQPWEVEQELEEGPELRMNVLRFPKVVDVTVKKGGKEMGLTFKKPKSGHIHELLIVDLAASGAVARHNSAQALGGKWDQVILPRMCIQAVNGIDGDLSKMLEALRACDVAELRVRRSGGQTPQVRPERVASLGLAALRVLQQSPGYAAGEERKAGHQAATSAAETGQRLLPVPAQRH